MRPSISWLRLSAFVPLAACFADVAGSAPSQDSLVDAGAGFVAGGPGGGGAGGGPGGGPSDAGSALDADTLVDAYVMQTTTSDCDGTPLGDQEQRTRYAEAQVVPPATCRSEVQTRTCQAGGFSDWTGSFSAEGCVSATVHSCGGVMSGGSETRTRYFEEMVADYTLCASEEQTRTCDDGTFSAWTGTAQYDACSVSFLGRCSRISGIDCEVDTSCTVLRFLSAQCLGDNGHSCSQNIECTDTCVAGMCVAAPVAHGGACDDVNDCAACSGGQVACSNDVCACGNGAGCVSNSDCVGTCVALQCVEANTTCDEDADCRDGRKCVKSPSTYIGTCLLPDGEPCTENAQCQNICRVDTCAALGGDGAVCDEQADCSTDLVCRNTDGTLHCAAPVTQGGSCEQTSDCADTLVCRSIVGRLQCAAPGSVGAACTESADCSDGLICATPKASVADAGTGDVCLTASGGTCASGLTCASGVCNGSGSGLGTCK